MEPSQKACVFKYMYLPKEVVGSFLCASYYEGVP